MLWLLRRNLLPKRSLTLCLCRFSNMRFVQFENNGRQGLGVELKDGGDIVDISKYDSTIPTNMREFLAGGETLVEKAAKAVESGSCLLKQNDVKLISPITNPEKLICIGMNYVDHCTEQNLPVPTEPILFSKFNNTITGPTDDIAYPDETEQLDWEVEMAIVVGKAGKNIKKEDAMQHVFGYTVAHDVSARDWQMHRNGGQFLIGKSIDAFCPLGPAIVMKEDLKDPHNLKVWTLVNGVSKQDSSTNQLVFKTEELISFISRFFTLTPGDTILTGTPPGVGVFRKPAEFLKRGDVVEVGIESIGKLVNKIV